MDSMDLDDLIALQEEEERRMDQQEEEDNDDDQLEVLREMEAKENRVKKALFKGGGGQSQSEEDASMKRSRDKEQLVRGQEMFGYSSKINFVTFPH